jgi:hypothetical protein
MPQHAAAEGLGLQPHSGTVGAQAVNQNVGWPDEYAVQVISTSKTEIQVLVRRLDLNSGWGQSLRLDFFIVD